MFSPLEDNIAVFMTTLRIRKPFDFCNHLDPYMDSDADIQNAGKQLEAAINTSAIAASVVAPTAMVATSLAEEVLQGIAHGMQQNKDAPNMFVHDSWLQGLTPPYGINQYKLHASDSAEISLRVSPIMKQSKQNVVTIAHIEVNK